MAKSTGKKMRVLFENIMHCLRIFVFFYTFVAKFERYEDITNTINDMGSDVLYVVHRGD